MVQLPREYKETTPTWLPLAVGGFFSAIGFLSLCYGIGVVLLGATFQSMLFPLGFGASFLFAGISCVIQMHWNYVRHTIQCTPAGFSVVRESKRRGARREEYRWGEVSSTEYNYTLGPSRKGRKSISGFFSVQTSRGQAFKVDHSHSDFDELITVFNEQTSHLPFIWARDSTFAARVTWASSAKAEYNKIPRLPPPPPTSRLPPLPPSN